MGRYVSSLELMQIELAHDGSILAANDKWLSFVGNDDAARTGNGWFDFIHPSDLIESQVCLRAALRNQAASECNMRVRRTDGEYRNLICFTTPFTGRVGRASARCLATLVDVTEFRRSDAQRAPVDSALAALKRATTASAVDSLINEAFADLFEKVSVRVAGLWVTSPFDHLTMIRFAWANGKMRATLAGEVDTIALSSLQENPLGRPVVIVDGSRDARLEPLRKVLPSTDLGTVVLLPLVIASEMTGNVFISLAADEQIPDALLASTQAVACEIALAIKLAAWTDKARIAATIEERQRIAADIHDLLAQGFTGIVVQLEAAVEALNTNPEKARAHLTRAHVLARESLTEARRSVHALHLPVLEPHDLGAIVRGMLDQFALDTSLLTRLDIVGTPGPIDELVSSSLIRICQEALTNALKYSGSNKVTVRFEYLPTAVNLRIHDSGVGFDRRTASAGPGLGVSGMRARVRRLGGSFRLRTGAGHGTTISVSAPRFLNGGSTQ